MGVVFSQGAAEKIKDTVETVEGLVRNDRQLPVQRIINQPPGMFLVRVTSTTPTAGRFPGKVLTHDDSTNTFTDGIDCWVRMLNGETPALERYLARRTGPDISGTGLPIYVAVKQAGGGFSPLTTKGDLYTRDASADARLPVGSNNWLLTPDSAETTGLKWRRGFEIPAGATGSGNDAFAFFPTMELSTTSGEDINNLDTNGNVVVLVDSTQAGVTIHGVVAPTHGGAPNAGDGALLVLVNVGSSTVTLPRQSGSTSGGNGFDTHDAKDIVLQIGEAAMFVYGSDIGNFGAWHATYSRLGRLLQSHSDTGGGDVQRGDLLVANSNLFWGRFARGSAFQVLSMQSTGLDLGWATLASLHGNQNANAIYAGPSSGGAAQPAFRFLAVADMPAQSAVGDLTDNTGGSISDTINDVGASFDQTTLNDNFASLADKINTILARLRSFRVILT